ncbi:MAG: sulfotransferase domain-containing protein [Melioribacteraceae bacterium]|nr:sulfotransferase domain-containing protein [Melioribacteraceae bacterium]MCF8262980.1 sulfotransferase domain-containing protein [Melioribacteraceae bacterium]MCF8430587.1 sulfotransferase domain-containing protein [Melioribacteraceae bacterium]
MNYRIRKLLIKLGYYSKPDFMIIGAQKSGTSALYQILKNHDSIHGARKKELHYFSNDERYLKKNSLREYHAEFPLPHEIPKGTLIFESTPLYMYHPKVAERLNGYNPDLKLIILLRSPAERALSAWTMYHHQFREGAFSSNHDNRSFKEAVEDELSKIDEVNFYTDKRGYVKRGIYHEQIQLIYNFFPREQVLVLESDELKNDFPNAASKISDFLRIEKDMLKSKIYNKSEVDTNDLCKSTVELLKEFYKPHNSRLYALLGERYNWND